MLRPSLDVQLQAELGAVREQLVEIEALSKQQKLHLNLQQSETSQATLQSKAAAAQVRFKLLVALQTSSYSIQTQCCNPILIIILLWQSAAETSIGTRAGGEEAAAVVAGH